MPSTNGHGLSRLSSTAASPQTSKPLRSLPRAADERALEHRMRVEVLEEMQTRQS